MEPLSPKLKYWVNILTGYFYKPGNSANQIVLKTRFRKISDDLKYRIFQYTRCREKPGNGANQIVLETRFRRLSDDLKYRIFQYTRCREKPGFDINPIKWLIRSFHSSGYILNPVRVHIGLAKCPL